MYIATVLTRRVCRRISANVAVTDHVARRLDLPRTRTIQHGIQRPTLLSRPPSAAGAGGGIPEFAFVGRLVPEKGLRLLLRAVGRLAGEGVGFRLTIIGDGPQRETLEREVRNLSLEERVHFAGTLEGESLEAALSEVTAVVMPSTWEETAGLVAIEHMMRGGLVVAADVGGLREVVGEAGIRFASGDEAALAASLRQVIEDPAAGVALGRRARDRAEERFGRRRMIVEHLELYRSARAP